MTVFWDPHLSLREIWATVICLMLGGLLELRFIAPT